MLSGWTIDLAGHSRWRWSRRLWKTLSNGLLEWERRLAGLPPRVAGDNVTPTIIVYRSTQSSAERLVTLPSTFAIHFASTDWEATDEKIPPTVDIARDLIKQGYSFFKLEEQR
jgi:hypothetical protein